MATAPRPAQNRRRRDPMNLANPALGVCYFAQLEELDDHSCQVYFAQPLSWSGLPQGTIDGEPITAVTKITDQIWRFTIGSTIAVNATLELPPDASAEYGPNVTQARCRLSVQEF